jgi:polar amino acid transport system permease protein
MTYVLQFGPVFQRFDLILSGLEMTIYLSTVAIIAGFVIGVIVSWLRTEAGRVSRLLAATYVEVFRNTPFLAQLFFITFGIPQFLSTMGMPVRPSPYSLAIVALSINLGAFIAEIVRAGLESVPIQQVEAAESLALTPAQIFLRIKLPPALAKVYPSLSGQFILQMLGSSIVSVIAVQELTAAAAHIQSETFRTFETYLVITALYFGLAFLMRALFQIIAAIAWPWRVRRSA